MHLTTIISSTMTLLELNYPSHISYVVNTQFYCWILVILCHLHLGYLVFWLQPPYTTSTQIPFSCHLFFFRRISLFPTMFPVQENTLRTTPRRCEFNSEIPAGDTIFFICWLFCHLTLTIYSWHQFYVTFLVSVHIPQVERVQNIVHTKLGPGEKNIYLFPIRTYGSDGMDDLQLIVRGLIDSE